MLPCVTRTSVQNFLLKEAPSISVGAREGNVTHWAWLGGVWRWQKKCVVLGQSSGLALPLTAGPWVRHFTLQSMPVYLFTTRGF